MDSSHAIRNNTTVRRQNSIEIIDLSTDDSEEEVIPDSPVQSTTTQPPVAAKKQAENPRLSHMTCVICLDHPTDLTATSCGHLFCHECLISALKVTNPYTIGGTCPVCRRKITAKSLVPLAILKRPALGAGAGAAAVE